MLKSIEFEVGSLSFSNICFMPDIIIYRAKMVMENNEIFSVFKGKPTELLKNAVSFYPV